MYISFRVVCALFWYAVLSQCVFVCVCVCVCVHIYIYIATLAAYMGAGVNECTHEDVVYLPYPTCKQE